MKFLLTTLLALLLHPAVGWTAEPPEIKFGKISQEELQMTHTHLDSSASAVVLADFGNTKINYNSNSGFQLIFTRHRRVKIFNSSGYNWADVIIPLYHDGSDRESISQIKGCTYNLENGKVVKTKLKNEGKFTEEYDENHQLHKFTLPNVKEGSVIEYTYRITSDFIFNLQDWRFQSSVPTVWSEYNVEIPEYFFYKPLSQGYYPFVINKQTTASGQYNISYRAQTPTDISQGRSQARQEQVNFQSTKYRWAAQNVPALIEEPYVTTMDDYVLKIEMELAGTRFPNELYKNYTTTWEEIDKQLLEHTYFGDVVKHTGTTKDEVASLTAGKNSDTEKVASIYQYVQRNIRWNQNRRRYADQTLRKTLETQSGNSADINLLLVAMLREAGISADPVVLSTRSHGLLRKTFPRLNQFNYVVALASTNDGQLLLDATDAVCPPGVLPVRCLNQEGRIVSKAPGEKWIQLHPAKGTREAVMAQLTLEDGQLLGTINSSYSGYNAMRLRRKVSQENGAEGYLSKLKEDNHSWAIQDYQLESLETVGAPVKETYQVVLQEGATEAGDVIYLNPIVTGRFAENPFKSESRAYPVDYPYPSNETYMLTLSVPEGYAVDELPENLVIALPEKAGRYTFTTQQQGNTVQITSRLKIDKIKFYAQEYPHLRQFFNIIVAKQQEQIVLKKIKS
ncbi:transglutaminase domain-containing protein [Tunicatimonas pelagia]|uniref:transglutaminase domain-containing protein n=1 Tax=Tunicatimonas pelagia TaxID=931531 RepID=UPI0026664F5E|nr:transglutaminase domain-containing protein [Tunicatimonas pelagia]WKN42525.1 transglutaminase domain-containing protein [Tunicatimonas pelagia]